MIMDIFNSLGYFILLIVVLGIQIPLMLFAEDTSTRSLSVIASLLLGVSILHHPIIGVI